MQASLHSLIGNKEKSKSSRTFRMHQSSFMNKSCIQQAAKKNSLPMNVTNVKELREETCIHFLVLMCGCRKECEKNMHFTISTIHQGCPERVQP